LQPKVDVGEAYYDAYDEADEDASESEVLRGISSFCQDVARLDRIEGLFGED